MDTCNKGILTLFRAGDKLDTTWATRMDESVLPPSKKFNIEATDACIEWKAWIECFNIYALAAEFAEKSESVQTAMMHCLGPTMLHCLGPSNEEKGAKSYQKRIKSYHDHKHRVKANSLLL